MKSFQLMKAFVGVALLFAPAVLTAQEIKIDKEQTRLLLAAKQTETLQRELDQVGAQGFHVVLATSRGDGEIVMLLERDISAREQHQFKVISTNATKTFGQEANEWARQGYRAVAFTNKSSFLFGIGAEILVVMERPVQPTRRYEYKLLAANQTSALESEWKAAGGEGYKAVGLIPRAEVMVLMEREVRP